MAKIKDSATKIKQEEGQIEVAISFFRHVLDGHPMADKLDELSYILENEDLGENPQIDSSLISKYDLSTERHIVLEGESKEGDFKIVYAKKKKKKKKKDSKPKDDDKEKPHTDSWLPWVHDHREVEICSVIEDDIVVDGNRIPAGQEICLTFSLPINIKWPWVKDKK